jgi:hypothetical protein
LPAVPAGQGVQELAPPVEYVPKPQSADRAGASAYAYSWADVSGVLAAGGATLYARVKV